MNYIASRITKIKTEINFDKQTFKEVMVLVMSGISLVLIHYYAINPGVLKFIKELKVLGFTGAATSLEYYMFFHADKQLFRLAWWVGVITLSYLVIPFFLIRFVFKERMKNFGFRFPSSWKSMRVYLVLLVFMVPVVWFFSQTDSFQSRYPFYEPEASHGLWPRFWIWQVMYLVQFFALEFFFRGFMVHGLKKRFGYFAVLFMVIPYCMIHFGKPMPESFSAILAGLALGFLSLKTNSILPGVLLHYGVAISMDLLALNYGGYFG